MYTLSRYQEDIRLLTRSLCIKHHGIGIVMNEGVLRRTGVQPSADPTTWKYYMNLAGLAHDDNNVVSVTLIENSLIKPLTRDILDLYPSTRRALDARTDMYEQLIKDYPDDILYINGCINPVDIHTAIDAKDGTILSWSDQYVEPQEFSLIRELTTRVTGYFARWYITEYNITDDLYMASVLGTLYAILPSIIGAIRIDDAGTSEAHSFHIEHFFRSHLDCWDQVRHLNEATIRWLYKNLVTLINNVGKRDTFDTIVAKILTPNGIGLAQYDLVQDALVGNTGSNLLTPSYTTPPAKVSITPLTDTYNNDTTELPITDLVTQELSNHPYKLYPDNIMLDTTINKVVDKIGSVTHVRQPTKVLDFGDISLYKAYTNSLTEIILDNWLYASEHGQYTNTFEFIDPNTKDTYALTPRDGILLFYYLLLTKFGNTSIVITDIKYTHRLNTHTTTANLLSGMLPATGTTQLANFISTTANNAVSTKYSNISTASDFAAMIEKQLVLYKEVWVRDSNYNNSMLSANIKKMVSRLYNPGHVVISSSGSSLQGILSSRGVNVRMSDTYVIDTTITKLFKTFTGLNLHEEVVVTEIYNNYKILIDKLTSYVAQPLTANVTATDIEVPYTPITLNVNDKGIISVKSAKVTKAYEDNNSTILGAGNDYVEASFATPLNPMGYHNIDASGKFELVSRISNVKQLKSSILGCHAYAEIRHSSYNEFMPDVLSRGDNINLGAGTTATYIGSSVTQQPDALNHVSIRAKVSEVNSAMATISQGATFAEIMYSSYELFYPGTNIQSTPYTMNAGTTISTGKVTPNVTVSSGNNTNVKVITGATITHGTTVQIL